MVLMLSDWLVMMIQWVQSNDDNWCLSSLAIVNDSYDLGAPGIQLKSRIAQLLYTVTTIHNGSSTETLKCLHDSYERGGYWEKKNL